MSVSDAEVARGISPPQRKGQARRRAADARRVQEPGDGHRRRRRRRTSRSTRRRIASARSARSATRWSTSSRCASRSTVPEADIEAFYKQNSAQYSTPEQIRASHILLQDRRQGRSGRARRRPKTCSSAPRRARTSPRSPSSISEDDSQQHQGRRPRLLRPRHDGAGVRAGGVRDEGRRDQRPGQDVVRLPHHQGRRSPAGDDASRWPRCGPRSRIS